jgi:mannose-6-phosphate isomerase-like protein (cupin superfamily)
MTRLLATDDDTGGRSSVYEMTVPGAFAGPPPHVHADRDHAFYVLEGTVRLLLGPRTVDATAGAFAYVPAGVAHTFGSPGDQWGRLLAFDTPGGWERYLRELTTNFPADHPVDPAEVAKVMARHDTRVVL